MNISEPGLRLIAEFEGFSPIPYNDPVGHCTVGYGELLHLGNCTAEELARPPITEAEGRRRLAQKAVPYAEAVARLTAPVNQHQFDALVSLCYNIGQGGYRDSTVRQAVNSGWDVCPELRKYVKGTDGVTYPGLVRRREAECRLFNTPADLPQEEPDRMYTDKQIDDKVAEALRLGTRNQAKVDELANGTDAVTKGALKYLWALANKKWPFG